MRPPRKRLAELDFGWASHKAALGWMDCIFRRPRDFEAEVEATAPERLGRVHFFLGWHFWSYYLLLLTGGRYLLCDVLRLHQASEAELEEGARLSGVLIGAVLFVGTFIGSGLVRDRQRLWLATLAMVVLFGVSVFLTPLKSQGIAVGIAGGIALGIALGIGIRILIGIEVAIAFGVAFGIVFGIAAEIDFAIAFAIAFGIVFGIVLGVVVAIRLGMAFAIGENFVGITVGIAGGSIGIFVGIIGVIAGGVANGIAGGIVVLIAFLVGFWRVFYLPSHLWKVVAPLVGKDPYRGHPLQVDQCIHLPLPRLDDLLMRYHDFDPAAADAEIDRLIDEYPSQRNAALRAKTRLLIRKAVNVDKLADISTVLEALPSGKKGFLAETEEVQRLAQEITVAAQRLENAPRGYLQAPYAESLVDKIEIFRSRIAGFKAPLSTELRKAAEVWKQKAEALRDKTRYLVPGGHFSPVFRADLQLDSEVDAFLPRQQLLVPLEEQVHLANTSAGLILLGRRRTGKSTLLNNLKRLVVGRAEVVVVSMQSPQAFTSITSLRGLLHEKLEALLPGAGLPPPGEDLRSFEALLQKTDNHLAGLDRKLLLAIDEYEAIDLKIAAGVFPEDLLALLRQSMQVHRRINWIFAGSRSPEDLHAAAWTSYLVSTRLLEMPLFSREETRELLTEPMKTSTLFKDPAKRPSFAPSFWGGEEGITRLHDEAAGWPHLVQLLAQHTVELVNQEGRTGLDTDLFERVCTKAVTEGTVVFTELLEKESLIEGEYAYLRQFRRTEEQDPPTDLAIERSLQRRWLVNETPEGKFRLRVPLMRRWLQARG